MKKMLGRAKLRNKKKLKRRRISKPRREVYERTKTALLCERETPKKNRSARKLKEGQTRCQIA